MLLSCISTSCPEVRENRHYLAIAAFYGIRCARRSRVPLLAHIDEGLRILDAIGASLVAKEAFCLHPLLQDDDALQAALAAHGHFRACAPDPVVVLLAMEYRRVANAYLAHHCKGESDLIELSPLADVNAMLIADKVQNRKDFDIHHLDSHENAQVLDQYFKNWLHRLDVSAARYQALIGLL